MARRSYFIWGLVCLACVVLIIIAGSLRFTFDIERPETADVLKHTNRFCFPYARGDMVPLQGQIGTTTNFGRALTDLSSGPDVNRVVDIGTWYGGGSTTA